MFIVYQGSVKAVSCKLSFLCVCNLFLPFSSLRDYQLVCCWCGLLVAGHVLLLRLLAAACSFCGFSAFSRRWLSLTVRTVSVCPASDLNGEEKILTVIEAGKFF